MGLPRPHDAGRGEPSTFSARVRRGPGRGDTARRERAWHAMETTSQKLPCLCRQLLVWWDGRAWRGGGSGGADRARPPAPEQDPGVRPAAGATVSPARRPPPDNNRPRRAIPDQGDNGSASARGIAVWFPYDLQYVRRTRIHAGLRNDASRVLRAGVAPTLLLPRAQVGLHPLQSSRSSALRTFTTPACAILPSARPYGFAQHRLCIQTRSDAGGWQPDR